MEESPPKTSSYRGSAWEALLAGTVMAKRTSDQPQPAREQDQHHQRVKQTRRTKVDVQIRDHSGHNKQRARRRQQLPRNAAPVPKQQPDSKQHWQQRDPKRVGAVEAPVKIGRASC